MNLEPLGLLGGRGRRDDPSAQEAGELQRKQRNTAGALGQHRIACNDPAPARESDPGGYRSTGQACGFLEREVARLVYVSSGTHYGVRPRIDDLLWTKRFRSGFSAYAENKLCDVLLAFAIASSLERRQIQCAGAWLGSNKYRRPLSAG